MKRTVARGRIVPQSLSTDPRYGRLSLKAQVLYPLLWINCDDQGRLSGDPDEVKYATCPSVKEISPEEIPTLLDQMEAKGMLKVYTTSRTRAIQMLDWWEEQRLQWAYPSRYPPPEGWTDHLRYHASPTEIIKENWPPSALGKELAKPLGKEHSQRFPLTTLPKEKEKEKEGGNRRGRGRLPSTLGSRSPPSLTADTSKILKELLRCFKVEWGRVPAHEPNKIIPREPTARESAQLRDLAKELSAGGVPLDYIKQAFQEAASHQKYHISYVQAVLYAWLGKERGPP